MKKKNTAEKIISILRIFILIFFFALVIFPIYWIFITSIKIKTEVIDVQNITYYPHSFTTQNYIDMFTQLNYGAYLRNSIYLSITSAALVTVISILSGYGLARYNFKGKKAMMLFVLITQMIPTILVLIPMYSIFSKAGVITNMPHLALFVFYVIANIPFCMITMKSFFERIPVALEEAAMIDGCSRLQCVIKVVVPVMLPSIVAVFCFAFIGAWNELLAGIIFTSQPSTWTIPVGLKSLIGKLGVPWGTLMAGGVMALLPTGLMFLIIQKYIVSGLTAGAVKE